jgi:2-polyprenyl-3-methyl-5-hydroxy-6-metoxy-1,4-benzoquinol methylase
MGSPAGVQAIRSIHDEKGTVQIFPLERNRLRIVLEPVNPDLYTLSRSCDTSLPADIIESLAEELEFAWLCDHIARLEDPAYVSEILKRQLFAYFGPEQFAGKRLMDFGCGIGASSIIMAECLPETEVVGVELDASRVAIARRLAQFKGIRNVRFEVSPTSDALPPGIGTFDFVMLSAVYEHLLPQERRTLMPLLWSHLVKEGVIFINQTPFRWSPHEHHSTGLWFINYLPASIAMRLARRFSVVCRETNRDLDWNGLLRHGIRGGTERDMLRNLCYGSAAKGQILQPTRNGLRDRADYWLSCTNRHRRRLLKKSIAGVFRVLDRTLNIIPTPNVDVVIRKAG